MTPAELVHHVDTKPDSTPLERQLADALDVHLDPENIARLAILDEYSMTTAELAPLVDIAAAMPNAAAILNLVFHDDELIAKIKERLS